MGHDLIGEHEAWRRATPEATEHPGKIVPEGIITDVQNSFHAGTSMVTSKAEDGRLHTSSAAPASSTRSSIMSMISEVEAPSVSSVCAAVDCAAASLEAAVGLLATQHYT